MTEPARLAKLPGYDTAPDVYETPEVAVEATQAAQTDNDTSSDSAPSDIEAGNSDEDGPFGGISHRRLFPERARSRFQAVGGRVETRGVDLSDRVDGRRKGLGVRRARPGTQAEDETLEARIARLRREVEECRVLAQESSTDNSAAVDALGKTLVDLEGDDVKKRPAETQAASAVPPSEESQSPHTLDKVAAFDGRLSSLERALGISTMDMDADGSFTAPMLPSLHLLDQQISALMAATSIAQLDAASMRVKRLAQDADRLAQIQAIPTSPVVTNGEKPEDKDVTIFSHEDMTKLKSLYALLPALQGLTPTVPLLLERLRSLTTLHSGAATAASELDAVVKKQADMEAELKSWEQSLDRLEAVVKTALEANGRNGKFVEGWVQDVQKRMEALR